MKTTQPSTEKQSLHSLQEEKQDHQGGLQSSMSSSFAGASIHPTNSHGFASIESPNAKNANAIQQMANESPVVQKAAQLKSIIQKKGQEGTSSNDSSTTSSSKSNHTGLPNALKTGVENLSGISMDDVKVHYNSHKPKEMNAHAYAQGNQIHLGSGQEKHLPHEAWHVVQQKQGRVKPTIQLKSGTYVNDNDGLENEATTMGERAKNTQLNSLSQKSNDNSSTPVVQGKWNDAEGSPIDDLDTLLACYGMSKDELKEDTIDVLQQSIDDNNKDFWVTSDNKEGFWADYNQVKYNYEARLAVKDDTDYSKPPAGKEWLNEYFALVNKHLAGEQASNGTLSGGHLYSYMQTTWKDKLNIIDQSKIDQNNPWEGEWHLGTIAKKKKSTFFPASWDSNKLYQELQGASRTIGKNFITLKSGINVQKKGDTFFPLME